MDIDEARRAKASLTVLLREALTVRAATATAAPAEGTLVSLGLAPRDDGGFRVALRYRSGVPTARMLVRRAVAHLGDDAVDARRTGRVRPLAPGRTSGAPGHRVVPTAQAAGETGHVRPLRPGVSIGRYDTTAGTLGAFVHVGGALHLLSNHHVLAGPAAQVGDAVVQPGPIDGGTDPDDRVATLTTWVPLSPGGRSRVDAAVAALVEPGVDPHYPAGLVTTVADVTGAEAVEKAGRTTGTTRGRVSAIELDDLVVDYGEGTGELTFDGQIEVEATGGEPFSRPGDSGSLVYAPDTKAAVGLLFAGSETGGADGTGLTYANPFGDVLESLGATLLGSEGDDDG